MCVYIYIYMYETCIHMQPRACIGAVRTPILVNRNMYHIKPNLPTVLRLPLLRFVDSKLLGNSQWT